MEAKSFLLRKFQNLNLKRGTLFVLTYLTVVRCPCCGSPFCVNNIPLIAGSFLLGTLIGGKRNKNQSE